MKNKILSKVGLLLAMVLTCSVAFTGCFGIGEDNTPKEYIIQYSDDAGTHTLTVKGGMPYSLESVPYRYGYEFLGLFDAQTGGTQYVGANGASLSPYNDKENKVLFPQFKPIDYTVILNYGEAEVTGERSLTVAYDSNLPELPKNLMLEHNEFTGWYTESGGQGTQIADAYGNLPSVSVLNEENFKLDDSRRVNLYAGFELEKYTVTFHFGDEMPSEEVEVPYGTPIKDVVPKTRNSEGKAGFVWSKSRDGNPFNENITGDLDLYVKEWAPVIEFDGNGADVIPIVAEAGTPITLPRPTKPLARFMHWKDRSGAKSEITIMPDESITLYAVWQGKIEFDENGGDTVEDLSKPAEESITLPTPEREGYIFAGWYTVDKEPYTQTKMPAEGIALKAGWYKEKQVLIILCSGDKKLSYKDGEVILKNELILDFSDYLPDDFHGNVKLDAQFKASNSDASLSQQEWFELYFYSTDTISDSYKLWEQKFTLSSKSYADFSYHLTVDMNGNKLYGAILANSGSKAVFRGWTYISDYRINLTYPDTTYLYL